MAISRWIRAWRKPADSAIPTGVVTQAALAGEALEELLPLAARILLDAAQADRVGVWLLSAQDDSQLTGIVLDARRTGPRPEWRKLSRGTAWLEKVISARGPVLTDLKDQPAFAGVGPLARMRTALGIPIRVERKTIGLVLVAYSFTRLRQEISTLQALVDELALAVSFRFARDQSQRAGQVLQARLGQTEKLAAVGQLVSGIAHELNNPLTSIMGYAQLLLAAPSDADRQANLRRVHQEAERARRIVQNLLFFAREAKPERQSLDLNEVVQRTLALRNYELQVENIAVELDLAPRLPSVLGDPHQLQQIVLNLLVNAEQAIRSTAGGRREERELRPAGRIRIRTRMLAEDRLALEVSDNGPGIPPGIASRIFDPFFTTKPVGQGTGLGLSIAYGIAQEHDGEIYVSAQDPSSGATFEVELPAGSERVTPPRAAPPWLEEMRQAGAEGRIPQGARVLVVEDEPTVAQLVADVLTEEGHRVESVLDSREGLARALRHPYDLVVCDLRMPRLDGRAFHEALVRAGSRQRIVFITGDTLGSRTLEFLESRRLPYLGKPFLVEELKAVVNSVLAAPLEPGPGASRPAPELVSAQPGAASSPGRRREAMRKP